MKKKVKGIVILTAVALLVLITVSSAFTIVEPGHTGVVVTLGKVNDNVLQEGIHTKIPFIQNVVKIDNRIRKLEVNTEAFSKDLQSVKTVLAINYRVDTAKSYSIYKNIGADYESVLVVPAVNEVLKAITSSYTAEQTVTNRSLISDGLVEGLNEKLNNIGLYVMDVNIIDFDFSEAFITAIEEKQVAHHQRRGGRRGHAHPRPGRSGGQRDHQRVLKRPDHRKQKDRKMERRTAARLRRRGHHQL